MDKNTLRKHALEKRAKISRDEANAASLVLAGHLLDAIPASARVVAGYRSIRGEIDVSGAFPELIVQGYTLCLPVVNEQLTLIFRSWQPGEKLDKGKFDTEIPTNSAPERVPDFIIAPLLAFDGKGHRLGYGAGYYDRTIAELRKTNPKLRVIGAAYESQRVDSIPADGYDEKMDAVVTEKGVVAFA
jgi:5-formyltetrahydrofolate cyclo-ligase